MTSERYDGATATALVCQTLGLLAEGMSNEQMAERLSVSVDTVKSRVSTAIGSMRARSRGHAVALAYKQGLLAPPDEARDLLAQRRLATISALRVERREQNERMGRLSDHVRGLESLVEQLRQQLATERRLRREDEQRYQRDKHGVQTDRLESSQGRP